MTWEVPEVVTTKFRFHFGQDSIFRTLDSASFQNAWLASEVFLVSAILPVLLFGRFVNLK